MRVPVVLAGISPQAARLSATRFEWRFKRRDESKVNARKGLRRGTREMPEWSRKCGLPQFGHRPLTDPIEAAITTKQDRA
jgi:hypothetical protein